PDGKPARTAGHERRDTTGQAARPLGQAVFDPTPADEDSGSFGGSVEDGVIWDSSVGGLPAIIDSLYRWRPPFRVTGPISPAARDVRAVLGTDSCPVPCDNSRFGLARGRSRGC